MWFLQGIRCFENPPLRELSFDGGGNLHTQKKKTSQVKINWNSETTYSTTIIEVQGMLNDL